MIEAFARFEKRSNVFTEVGEVNPAIAGMIKVEMDNRAKMARESRELDELIDNAEDEGD